MKLPIIIYLSLMSLSVGAFELSIKEDKMTGTIQAFAISRETSSDSPMGFPYADVTSSLVIGCNGDGGVFPYFWFSESPNLSNTNTHDGYSSLTTRIKYDNDLSRITLNQDWGENTVGISTMDKVAFVNKIKSSNKVLLELTWHGEGRVYFEYPLNGSTKTIDEAFSKCGISSFMTRGEKEALEKQEQALQEKESSAVATPETVNAATEPTPTLTPADEPTYQIRKDKYNSCKHIRGCFEAVNYCSNETTIESFNNCVDRRI